MREIVGMAPEAVKWMRECLALGAVLAFAATATTWVEAARTLAAS